MLLTLRFLFILFIILTSESLHAQALLTAPNQKASPINQRRAYGNACGPASLLNAFQYGSEKWQKAYGAVPGENSRSRIRYVVSTWGNKPSEHIKGVNRWNIKQGINLLDLTDMANEMRVAHFLPKIKNEVFTIHQDEPKKKLLRRSHKRMAQSLKKGLPPIISIRRYAYRYDQVVGEKTWWPIRAHFVVVIELPKKLPKEAQSFKIRYVDPYGGFVRSGTITATKGQFAHSPFLIANFPKTIVGGHLLKSGEQSELSFTSIIGTW